MNDPDLPQKIEKILRINFPNADGEKYVNFAFDIWQSWEFAQDLQRLERSNATSEKDLLGFTKALKHIRSAHAALDKVGVQGGKALIPFAMTIRAENLPKHYRPVVTTLAALPLVKGKLKELESGLKFTLDNFDHEGSRIIKELNIEFKKGRHPESAATRTAKKCAAVFESLSGQPATRRTGYENGNFYGPYFNFVSDVFQALDIDANVERACRNALTMDKKLK